MLKVSRAEMPYSCISARISLGSFRRSRCVPRPRCSRPVLRKWSQCCTSHRNIPDAPGTGQELPVQLIKLKQTGQVIIGFFLVSSHPLLSRSLLLYHVSAHKKAPGGACYSLRGASLCALCLGAHDRRFRRFTRLQSNSGSQAKPSSCWRSRQLDVQDAILELCVDVLLLHGVAT